MSKFPSFVEYLNDKGNLVEKPDIETVPDYHGPDDKTPPNSKVPYKTPVANKAPEKGENGLAELGDDKLKYQPDTKLNYSEKPDALKKVVKEYVDEKGKVLEKGREDIKADYKGTIPSGPKNGAPYVAKDAKTKAGDKGLGELGEKEFEYNPDTKTAKKVTKTENFINKTKDMSLSEFTKYMLKECGCGQVNDENLPFITAYTTGKFQPHPPEAIRYVTVLANKNQGILENLVSQVISMGYLNKLLKAIFDHPQSYEELTNLFSDEEGPARCNSFVGSMSNSYTKFLSDQDGLYESVSSPIGFDDNKDMEDMEDMSDEEDEDMEDMGDEDMGDEDLDDDEDEDMEDMDDEEDEDMEDMEDENMEDMGDEEMGEVEPERKLKKKFAHDHLLDAMKNHEHMLKRMRGN